jgi:hypothetical protein
MIRRFNYTHRQRISHADVQVLLSHDGETLRFDAELQLDRYDLPPDASLYIEAYYRTEYVRYSYGTIGAPVPCEDRSLSDFSIPDNILFRIKVVDESSAHGRLLAVGDRIAPHSPESTEKRKICLLHVEHSNELGDRVWKLDLNQDWPLLLINSKVDGLREIVRNDDSFFALVYPEITQAILREILFERGIDEVSLDDDASWESLWLRFAAARTGPPPESETDNERNEWIERAVTDFCGIQQVRERYRNAIERKQNA